MTDRLLDRLGALETGQVSDVLDEAGLPNQAISGDLVALGDTRMVGRAACARGAPLVQAAHATAAQPADALERIAAENTVVLIDTGGFNAGAVLGGFVAYSLQRQGCRGVVVDGAVRDADEIRGYGLPIFSRSVTPINGARRFRLTELDVEISLPGHTGVPVTVRPGDLVLGDGDGVVVIPAGVAEQVIEDSEELARIEAKIGSELKAGGVRAEVFKANPRFAHIRSAV